MPLGPLLLLIFLAVPLVEVALFVQVGGWIGLWPTLLAIVVTALAGSAVIRHQGLSLARRAQSRLATGVMPVREGFDGLCLVGAGLLMITPGFFTDALGALLLIPAARGAVYARLARRIRAEMPDGVDERSPRDGVVDVDYEVIDDDAGPLPPPRGGWDRDRK